jgi:hypothetical protein
VLHCFSMSVPPSHIPDSSHSGSVPKIVLVSSIPGVRIEKCLESVVNFLKIEEGLTAEAFSVEGSSLSRLLAVARGIYPKESFKTPNFVLGLPLEKLTKVCIQAFENTIDEATNTATDPKKNLDIIFIHFHPVIFHQITSEYALTYSSLALKRIFEGSLLRMNWIVSLHDDIYDTYRPLLQDKQLFHKGDPADRELKSDIADLMQVLSWRDRELSTSKSLAMSLGAKHLLIHAKGRAKSLVDIVHHGKPCVYFSHAISQPRKDINGQINIGKSETADVRRGEKLIESCQRFANALGRDIPLIEPTCIDEMRIMHYSQNALDGNDLSKCILPPLTKRWPIGEGWRIKDHNKEEDERPLLSAHELPYREMSADLDLSNFKEAFNLLNSEIHRQIKVRDYTLASQAKLVIAYRPFAHPDAPTPTGGVDKEISTASDKSKDPNTKNDMCVPAVLIVDLMTDEIRRRENEFKGFFEKNLKERLINSGSNPESITRFKDGFRQLLSNFIPFVESENANLSDLLSKMVVEAGIQLPKSEGSLGIQQLLSDDTALIAFIDEIINGTAIFISLFHKSERESSSIVQHLYLQDDSEKEFARAKSRVREIIARLPLKEVST